MSARVPMIAGSTVAIPTPFLDERIDDCALARLCERQIEHGTNAIVVCGSTGEAASLTPDEHTLAVRVAVEAVDRRLPVIAGCTAPATAVSIGLAVGAARAGADGLLCAAPPYSKPTQDGIVAHIRALSHATDLPIIRYDVPSCSAVAIADATVAELYARELIVAIKDATADLSRPPRLRALCGPSFTQLTGDDATAAAYRAMGGAGSISVTANITPALCAGLHKAWDSGDLARFATLRDLLGPLHAALFAESNPISVKAALGQLGLCCDALRLPLRRATEATSELLRGVLDPLIPLEESAARRSQLAIAS
jgi:4-hydroxy-tetrahydrodipicolinate synthase